ncbi:hypothetical protein [Streptomyces sp. BE230]|uniref:hypothetical protein n=1 Tax=Streptomyces sp. BE230 TaxID=3002526 RepID=UPI002ED08BB4|nr:hypothetical protein [Streptomyces sp. BE230]
MSGAGSPTEQYDITYTSGMFTTHQLKPRTAVSLAFTGWAHWLRQHGLSHSVLITRYRAGFVPVGVRVTYEQPHDFLDGDSLTVQTALVTWQPRRFPTCQQLDTRILSGETLLAGVRIQMVGVRIESDASLAALPGTTPEPLAGLLCDPTLAGEPPPRFLSRAAPADEGRELHHWFEYPFTVHRGMCEIGDQWYFESVPDLLGAARESLVFAAAPRERALLPGLSEPLTAVQYGLKQPFCFLDTGTVRTRVHAVGEELRFVHELVTAGGVVAGHALETVQVAGPGDSPTSEE